MFLFCILNLFLLIFWKLLNRNFGLFFFYGFELFESLWSWTFQILLFLFFTLRYNRLLHYLNRLLNYFDGLRFYFNFFLFLNFWYFFHWFSFFFNFFLKNRFKRLFLFFYGLIFSNRFNFCFLNDRRSDSSFLLHIFLWLNFFFWCFNSLKVIYFMFFFIMLSSFDYWCLRIWFLFTICVEVFVDLSGLW